MHFLFSGEGPTDFGFCNNGESQCEGDAYEYGPMAIIVDHIVESRWNYSLLESGNFSFVTERQLVRHAQALKIASRKSLRLPRKLEDRETTYFYRNARSLALCALDLESMLQDEVIAVLFRDSDGTVSQGRGVWERKKLSAKSGFTDQNFSRGVAMIPKPKSEAWFICALKAQPYQFCARLETRSGNDRSPNSLKKELAELHGGDLPTREELNDHVSQRRVDIGQLAMPSFLAFKQDLENALETN